METHHSRQTVRSDGSIVISGLPPQKEVEVIIVEPIAWENRFTQWMDGVKETHRFNNMSKDEILAILRQVREEVADERHQS